MRNDLVKVVCANRVWWNYYRGFDGNDSYESVKAFTNREEAIKYAESFNEKYIDKEA